MDAARYKKWLNCGPYGPYETLNREDMIFPFLVGSVQVRVIWKVVMNAEAGGPAL